MSDAWPWVAVVLLGAYHGINPAMGWLFAVARGLQERSRTALLQALPAIALGHLASVTLVVVLVGFAQVVAASSVLRLGSVVALIALGAYKFFRPHAHPRWIGMQVTLRELTLWSFLMSTAHGAGLMLLPVLFRLPGFAHAHAAGEHALMAPGAAAVSLAGGTLAAVHTLAMFVAMTVVALLVFEKIGVGILRRAWLNLDRVWAGAVVLSGIFTLLKL